MNMQTTITILLALVCNDGAGTGNQESNGHA